MNHFYYTICFGCKWPWIRVWLWAGTWSRNFRVCVASVQFKWRRQSEDDSKIDSQHLQTYRTLTYHFPGRWWRTYLHPFRVTLQLFTLQLFTLLITVNMPVMPSCKSKKTHLCQWASSCGSSQAAVSFFTSYHMTIDCPIKTSHFPDIPIWKETKTDNFNLLPSTAERAARSHMVGYFVNPLLIHMFYQFLYWYIQCHWEV